MSSDSGVDENLPLNYITLNAISSIHCVKDAGTTKNNAYPSNFEQYIKSINSPKSASDSLMADATLSSPESSFDDSYDFLVEQEKHEPPLCLANKLSTETHFKDDELNQSFSVNLDEEVIEIVRKQSLTCLQAARMVFTRKIAKLRNSQYCTGFMAQSLTMAENDDLVSNPFVQNLIESIRTSTYEHDSEKLPDL